MKNDIATKTLALVALNAMFALGAQAHSHMRGPLPKDILEHSEDIGYLTRVAGLDTDDSSKGLYGLHYYYALDSDARRLTLKLLNSDDVGAQIAALRIIGHCGGGTSDKDVSAEINLRLSVLSSSTVSEVRKSALEVRRALRKREKEMKNKVSKKTARP